MWTYTILFILHAKKGTGIIKAGFAGDQVPKINYPNW